MSKYLKDNEINLTSALEKDLRNRITDWAAGFSAFPYKNLGREIDIRKVQEIWCYKEKVSTQWESRHPSNEYRPFYLSDTVHTGELVTLPVVLKHVYSYKLNPVPHSFTDSASDFTVNESKYHKTCFTCSGEGKVDCPECDGKGSFHCKTCDGTGQVPDIIKCPSCHGNGSVSVNRERIEYRTDSDGQRIAVTVRYQQSVRCSHCNGTGEYKRGMKDCERCHGKGRITCNTCKGERKIECNTCRGQKELLHYVNINQAFSVSVLTKYFVDMSDADFELYAKARTDSDFMPLETVFNPEGALTENQMLGIEDENFRKSFSAHVASESKNSSPDTKRLHFQGLDTFRSRLLLITFLWKGDEYKLWLTPAGKMFSSHSPLNVYGEKQKAGLQKDLKWGNPYSAYQRLEKLTNLSEQKQFAKLKESIAVVLKGDVMTGAKIACMFLFVLAWDLNTWYLSNFGFAAPWIDTAGLATRKFYMYVPFIYAVLQLVASYFVARKVAMAIAVKCPSAIIRWLAGACLALACYVAAILVTYLLHFLILPPVLETIGFILNIIPSLFFGVNWF